MSDLLLERPAPFTSRNASMPPDISVKFKQRHVTLPPKTQIRNHESKGANIASLPPITPQKKSLQEIVAEVLKQQILIQPKIERQNVLSSMIKMRSHNTLKQKRQSNDLVKADDSLDELLDDYLKNEPLRVKQIRQRQLSTGDGRISPEYVSLNKSRVQTMNIVEQSTLSRAIKEQAVGTTASNYSRNKKLNKTLNPNESQIRGLIGKSQLSSRLSLNQEVLESDRKLKQLELRVLELKKQNGILDRDKAPKNEVKCPSLQFCTALDVDASPKKKLQFIANPLLINAAVAVTSPLTSRPISPLSRLKKMFNDKERKESATSRNRKFLKQYDVESVRSREELEQLWQQVKNRPTNKQRLQQLYDDEERKIVEKIKIERRGPVRGLSMRTVLAKKIEGLITPQNEEVRVQYDASIKFQKRRQKFFNDKTTIHEMMFLGRLQDSIEKLGSKKFNVEGIPQLRTVTPSIKVDSASEIQQKVYRQQAKQPRKAGTMILRDLTDDGNFLSQFRPQK